ncbi:MAG: NUDIX hydrolase [Patescibacteria group bacterium]
MQIKETILSRSTGQPLEATYKDIDDERDFSGLPIWGARAYCFYGDKLVVVHENKGHWNLPGGGIEDGEDVSVGIHREIKEETNMRVLKMRYVGLQEAHQADGLHYYVRAVCLVEPEGDFLNDPGGEVMETKLIDPSECIQLTDAHWGKIGVRMLERALELKEEMGKAR